MSHGVVKPRWRDFGDVPTENITPSGQSTYVSALIDRVLDRVAYEPERWKRVLDVLRTFAPAQRDRAMKMLDARAQSALTEQARESLWIVVREFASRHRTFERSEWALAAPVVDRLVAIAERLKPVDPVDAHRWLFDDWLPELPSGEQDINLRRSTLD